MIPYSGEKSELNPLINHESMINIDDIAIPADQLLLGSAENGKTLKHFLDILGNVKKATPIDIHNGIKAVEEELQTIPQVPEEDHPLRHFFSNGVYLREIKIPAGVLLTGKTHKHSHLNILVRGDVSYLTEKEGAKRIKSPSIFESPIGSKRLLFTHSETIWITIHSAVSEDIKENEEEIFEEGSL